jgi:hypothetical protein
MPRSAGKQITENTIYDEKLLSHYYQENKGTEMKLCLNISSQAMLA